MKVKIKDYKTGKVYYEEDGRILPDEVVDESSADLGNSDNLKFDECDNFSLQTLRKIARKVGVKAPTSLSKQQLIEAIISVSTGETEPVGVDNRLGRPPKEDDFMSVYSYFNFGEKEPEEDIETKLDKPYKMYTAEDSLFGTYMLNCPPMSYNEDLKIEREIRTGYLFVLPNGYGRVRINGYKIDDKDICISQFLIQKHKLRSGQLIKGRCRRFQDGKPEVMYDVLSVEGQALNDEDIVLFDEMESLPLDTNINFSNKLLEFEILNGITVEDIKFGGKYFVKNIDKQNLIEKTNCFVKTIANHNKAKIIYIQASAKPDDKTIDVPNVECVKIPFGESSQQSMATIQILWEKAKRYAECNDNTILVLANYIDCLKIFNRAITEHINVPISTKTWDEFKQSLLLGKKIGKSASLTLVAFDNLLVTKDLGEFVEVEVLPNFDKLFQI